MVIDNAVIMGSAGACLLLRQTSRQILTRTVRCFWFSVLQKVGVRFDRYRCTFICPEVATSDRQTNGKLIAWKDSSAKWRIMCRVGP